MFKCCLFAVAVIVGICSPACAETFLATITKVEGDKVTYLKATYHAGKSGADKYTHDDPVTTASAKDVTVTRGHFLPVPGETATEARLTGKATPLKDGLDNVAFKTINAGKPTTRPCLITVADKGDDKGKITAINFWSSGSPK